MFSKKIIYFYIFSSILIILVNGCSNSSVKPPITKECSNRMRLQKDAICYRGIYFGNSTDAYYKEGIKDGCKTGFGNFSKNYYYSRLYPTYRKGWDIGRRSCHIKGHIKRAYK